MRRYEEREGPVRWKILVESRCDGCGVLEADAEGGPLIPVAIEVNLGEEGGRRDEYDYCNDCLIGIAPLLSGAGSRSELVAEPEDDRG